MINLNVQYNYYFLIIKGLKVSEGRIAKDKYLSLKPDEVIKFTSNQTAESIYAIVLSVKKYNGFEQMLQNEGLSRMIPGAQSIKDGIKIYESFGNYKKDVKKYGCVAINFKIQS